MLKMTMAIYAYCGAFTNRQAGQSVATLAFLASNSSVNTLEILRRAAAKMLAKMLVGEHPQTRLSAARR